MARKVPSKVKTTKSACSRKPSPELGDGDLQTRYNSRTGRPIRDGAGRKSTDPSYLDTTEVIDDDGLESESGSEDGEGVKKKRSKRKRTPSPPLPDVDALPLFPKDVPSREPTPLADEGQNEQSINLTVNIPKGFAGPFLLKIDRNMLNGGKPEPQPKRNRLSSTETSSSSLTTGSTINVRPRKSVLFHSGASDSKTRADSTKRTFAELPAEIRNQIYRLLFVTKDTIRFSHPVNFKRSSAFLRTCKQIYNEGRSVLYSENAFAFSRNTGSRAPYWESQEKEIGYQDMRVFLNSIGPTNISERRFVRDEHVIYCLRQISSYGKLKDMEVSFYGRKSLVRTDYRFLDALREIKVDELCLDSSERHWYRSKIDYIVKTSLEESMVRSPKLYEQE
ncbi:hypothetical protein SLS57_002913 [Botryosphaeria dothidea]